MTDNTTETVADDSSPDVNDARASAPGHTSHYVPAPDPDLERPATGIGSVPMGVKAASEWSWRLLLIAAGLFGLGLLVRSVSEVIVPLAISVLLTALLRPVALRLRSVMPAGAAAGLTVLGTILVVSALLTLVGSQFTKGFADLTTQVGAGISQIRDWVRTTFKISDAQFDGYWDTIREKVSNSGNLGDTATAFGLTATHFVAGVFISLFALFFFLYEGPRIWAWVVRLFPRTARDRVDSSAVIAWDQLSAFVRATMIVAFVDAVGIGVGAAILGVPFAFAIGILVFLLAFIPIVGALLSGFVAVVLALVSHGPGVALIMLAIVIGVQQLESHVLQPFLLGKAVSVHPLAVILAIAIGSITAGIVGALVAVPFAAVINAVGKHLLVGESREELEEELEERAHQGGSPATA
ncbi:putative PurR-regulated permease PerM [Humibacillus xanthopallidus]|uniref:Putative PurR-regulated permease PerM n=1 Tax=Humibacillus xanthopallidus TaxID=412689 RepID=A0A543PY87_9MICO|nr:AI-2E family transporter [Humibacillus xanthopallidus]TQN49046.1 putative PurR-regulated permease PerM [Humibacillus xanthopallidus]